MNNIPIIIFFAIFLQSFSFQEPNPKICINCNNPATKFTNKKYKEVYKKTSVCEGCQTLLDSMLNNTNKSEG
jgi:uncharacterized protein with PIN domain